MNREITEIILKTPNNHDLVIANNKLSRRIDFVEKTLLRIARTCLNQDTRRSIQNLIDDVLNKDGGNA